MTTLENEETKLRTYSVYRSQSSTCTFCVEVQAASENQALKKAYDIPFDDWDEFDDEPTSEWEYSAEGN